MDNSHPDLVILGPYRHHNAFSINSYYDLISRRMPSLMPHWRIEASAAGNWLTPGAEIKHARWVQRTADVLFWLNTMRHCRARSFHLVDQGIAWYASHLYLGRGLVTVHDIRNLISSDNHNTPRSFLRKRLRCKSVEVIRHAAKIIAVSSFTADCLVASLNIPGKHITVIPNCLPSYFFARHQDPSQHRARLFPGVDRVVLSVSTRQPHKN
jgi:glycosyltransferase involved in cell wall biosynthesis